jgi:hypothetical protein
MTVRESESEIVRQSVREEETGRGREQDSLMVVCLVGTG